MIMKNFALVIEDDADLSDIFTRALQTAGFEVETIRDGRIAEKRLQEIIPNVIVLDLHLPHVDGVKLLKQLHANEAFSNTQIIMTTADNIQAEMYGDLVTIAMVKPISFGLLRDISARLKTT